MPRNDTCSIVVFHGPGEPLEFRAVRVPVLEPGEALVRITWCTLCGSDLHTYQGRRSTPTPTILGHEILGRIEHLGPGDPLRDIAGHVLEPGDRVTWTIAASCGECFYCTHGLPQKCKQLFKYGHERITDERILSGGLAEYCRLARGTGVLRLPDAVPDAVACPVNCATATVAAALRVGGGCDGDTVLVQGAGMLGLTACAMARANGACHVIACDVDSKRLDLARRFGATECVTPDAVEDAVGKTTAGRGVDLALELSGAPEAMVAGLDLLRIGGRYVLVGAVFPGPDLAVSPERVIRRLLSVHGIHNYTPGDLADAVDFLAHHHAEYPFEELVSEIFPLSEVASAFDRALETRALRIAVRP